MHSFTSDRIALAAVRSVDSGQPSIGRALSLSDRRLLKCILSYTLSLAKDALP
ncbi:MAG: hypothetical protein R2825_19950 [Saprospiraceae bacterium]